ncbi:hypothetical protein [Lysinibacillus sp. NPDC059133]|uniref:hypothetical protein n=1 Tax=Lysinibacillus sp. NPDC059133 TaxID=3346737 RepID=UPI0036BCCC92
MADCRTQFNKFHENIKLKEENEILQQTDYESRVFNQGSYAMHTGSLFLGELR